MRFGKWILAASVPLMLAGCGGGGGGGAQSVAVQGLLDNTTNLEMTDRYSSSDRDRVICSGTDCESLQGGQITLSYHARWLSLSSSGRAGRDDDDNATYNMIRRLGQYSGYYAIKLNYANTGLYRESFSAAFGGPERKPVSGTGTWTGNMGGHEVSSGIQLNGKSTVTYSFGNNSVDVRLYDISGSGYFGDRVLSWEDMSVRNDGSFSYSGSDYVVGNFYGPNAEETTGIFEDGTLAGAWFADR